MHPSSTIYHLLDEAEQFSEVYGGAISRWAGNVLQSGEEVVVCPSFDSSWGFPAERLYQLPEWRFVRPLHPLFFRSPWVIQLAVYTRVFQTLLKKLNPGDTIYVHNRPEYASVLSVIAKKWGVNVILHMHNSLLLRSNRGQINALRDTPIIFVSEYLRKETMEAYPNHFQRTFVVYNGADASKFHTAVRGENKAPVVIYSGRLVPHKGVHVLLDAMRILEQKGIPANCRVVGGSGFGGSKGTSYTRKLELMKPGNSELTGYMDSANLAEALRNSDIFCCPSTWNDPFPLAPLEAMGTGLPVVASNTGGLPEALAYGGGVLVPANNPVALADALEKLVSDTPYRHQLGDAAIAAFHGHFLWSMVRNQYETVIRELAS